MEVNGFMKNLLVVVVALAVHQSDFATALSQEEIDAFGARTHIDSNTGVQGYITIDDHDDDYYIMTSNGVPDHDAGPFAVPDEFADIVIQSFEFYVPKNPTPSDVKYELPMGPVGLALNGVALFNPYAATGEDAVITEEPTFDECDGHPTPDGVYHYHGRPICVFDVDEGIPSDIVGVAMDGFPVYGPNDENGNRLYSADLDTCHGRWVDGDYRYHITDDFPYILGCFNGVVDARNLRPGQVLATVIPDSDAMTTTGKGNVVKGSVLVVVTVCLTMLMFE